MAQVIPAVIPNDIDDLKEHCARIIPFVSEIQVDVTDGHFVPSKSWPYTRGGEESFARIKEEKDGLPYWDELDYEIDLMVKDPEQVIDDWIRAGAKRIVIHFESTKFLKNILAELRKKYEPMRENLLGIEIGLAIGLETPNTEIYPYLSRVDDEGLMPVDFVQFMGIRHEGFQGEPFAEEVYGKIREMRARFPDIMISVDGGVSLEDAPKLLEAGANRLIAGSAVFGSKDIGSAIKAFQAL
ncbi:MAG: hypothetical protein WCW14_02380 [Candidatus Paceibacterota bacterium]|jgi:ribulose-phosphate 3-epimerase